MKKAEILFISDLHLSFDKPEITRRFLEFLATHAIQSQSLYILGDLFDTWVGDDDFSPPANKIRAALRKVTEAGTAVFIQPGNRDFLLGQQFCLDTGVKLLGDYHTIDLYGVPTLLMHGDLLCTDDLPYQAFRNKSRTEEWQRGVLSKPLLFRLLAARWYRLKSHFHKRKKTQDIMDVNHNTVVETMIKYHCTRLIHGHTHRPNLHFLDINGISAQRFVLSDWSNTKGEVLIWRQNGYLRQTL